MLGPGGWAAFQVSNDQEHEAWVGSSVELAALRDAARAGRTEVEAITGEGIQLCLVLLRRPAFGASVRRAG